MLYFRNELLEKYNSTYKLRKALKNEEIFKVSPGLYSDKKYVGTIEIIAKKYPNAVLTGESAYYYNDLTDVIPDVYYIATPRNYTRIKDENIKQIFVPIDTLTIGMINMEIENTNVNVYNKERMLVELVKKKKQIPFDYYKEIILNYRNQINDLDIYKIRDYVSIYPSEKSLFHTIQREVF